MDFFECDHVWSWGVSGCGFLIDCKRLYGSCLSANKFVETLSLFWIFDLDFTEHPIELYLTGAIIYYLADAVISAYKMRSVTWAESPALQLARQNTS